MSHKTLRPSVWSEQHFNNAYYEGALRKWEKENWKETRDAIDAVICTRIDEEIEEESDFMETLKKI